MPTVAALRYRDTITRRRYDGGDYNDVGRWVRGEATETAMRGSVQPVALEDLDRPGEGARLVGRLRIYVPASSGGLRGAEDGGEADQVVYGGKVYTVEESRTWATHTRAILLRET